MPLLPISLESTAIASCALVTLCTRAGGTKAAIYTYRESMCPRPDLAPLLNDGPFSLLETLRLT